MADVEANDGSSSPKKNYEKVTTTPAELDSGKENKSIVNNITIINNDSLTSPGTYGTFMSFLTLIIAIIVSIICYSYAADNLNTSAFNDVCTDSEYESSCKANSAVLRISFALSILFAVQILFTKCFTKFFDLFWPIKFLCFCGLVILFYNIHTDIFGLGGYAWFARITGFFYLILEQIILVDLAYTWNEKWIEYSQEENLDSDAVFKGNMWLTGIIVFSVIFYAFAFILIGILYWQFNNSCVDTMIILSLGVALPVLASIIQLFFSDQGSILTSSVMTLYTVYVVYSAISLNPDSTCNPTLDSGYQTLSAAIGLSLTAISMIWSTYSAVQKIPSVTDKQTGESIDLTNIATGGKESSKKTSERSQSVSEHVNGPYGSPVLNTLFVQVSCVFLSVSGYYCMVLTNWATEQTSTSLSNPRAGRAAMWIQAAGSWIAITLYLWTLIAPKILSDREFN